ncbi:MAG: cytochrome c maturation protein CcmE [Deltaproteobacteria bacterium]|nr:cytochrome c maturation protein CcmE [Deltaproteobacteria bacterium]
MDGEIRTNAEDTSATPDVGTREAFEALKSDAAPVRRAARAERPRWQGIAKLAVLLGLGGVVVAWALTSSESPFVYSVMVADVVGDPSAFEGRTLRMEGPLRDGSIQFRQDPCEYRFVLAEGEGEDAREMNVRFPQCVVPDTFRDGMGISVVVEGHVQDDGSFLATQVIPRCPSRYEMDQRQQNGEAAPHAMPSS